MVRIFRRLRAEVMHDASKIRVMSNRYQRAQGMQVRSQHEIPMLVSHAREIISLLQREYPE